MNYESIIEKLISQFQLDSDIRRKKAYQKCIEYADENLDDTPDYNPFVAKAADRLGQDPIVKDIVKRSVEESGNEKLHLAYSDQSGPKLTANKEGLSHLSKVLKNLSQAKMAHEHVHFYSGEPPLYGNSYSLIVYLVDDNWFPKHGQRKESENKLDVKNPKLRDINAANIVAFRISEGLPLPLMMTPHKVYRVLSCSKLKGQKVWMKNIRDEVDRLFVFKFKRDDGELQEVALDLDDDSVLFFTNRELAQFTEVLC